MGAMLHVRQCVNRALAGTVNRRPSPGTLTVLMYHAITADRLDEPGQMSVSADTFDQQMAELQASGVTVVDLASGVADLVAGRLQTPAAAVVFDDGFVGVHAHAAEVLARRRVPATVFVTTSWIGQPAMPLSDATLGRPMTWAEVNELSRAGIVIGSHTDTHPVLARVSADQVRQELRRSADVIEEHTGTRPVTFAYPYGAYGTFNGMTRSALGEAEFVAGCTTVFGRNVAKTDPLALHRIRVSWCDGPGAIRAIVAGAHDWYRMVQAVQAVTQSRRAGR